MHTVYTGERIRLRPFKDADEFKYIRKTEDTRPNEHWGPWSSPQQELDKEFADGGLLTTGRYSAFAVERLDTGEVVGYEEFGGIRPGHLTAWIGTFILPAHQHNGFGIEAKLLCLSHLFENFPLRTVFAVTTGTHTRAQSGMVKAGMSYLGARRKAHIYKGDYVDAVFYAISRSQWEKLPIRQTVRRG